MGYLLGIMAIAIYNQTYGTSTVVKLMERYNKIMEDAMGIAAFDAIILTIKSLAVGITILLYMIDLSEKVTEKNFSIEQLFKATLRCIVAYMFIMNANEIVGYLMDIGTYAAESVSEVEAGYDFFADNTNNKAMLINGISQMKMTEKLSYIVYSLLPWILSMIGEIILQIILISRILEIIVLTAFAPLAISDIYREGTSSPGIQYMKKVFAIGLQIAVIILINVATQAIISNLVGAETGKSIVKTLKPSEKFSASEIPGAIESGKLVFTYDSIVNFLNVLTGHTNMLKALGVMLARIGLIWNSMPLCEEITGAK